MTKTIVAWQMRHPDLNAGNWVDGSRYNAEQRAIHSKDGWEYRPLVVGPPDPLLPLPVTPWWPTTDQHQLAALGKLAEEASELAKACVRAMIQGLDGTCPGQDGTNEDEIRKEWSDVRAAMEIIDRRGVVDLWQYDGNRFDQKVQRLKRWHEMLDEGPATPPNDAWKEYAADFNAFTDAELAREVRDDQTKLDDAESFLEAVASWEAAGKPRTKKDAVR